MSATIRRLTTDATELTAERWRAFAGADPTLRELNRQCLLGHMDALANEFWIASMWDQASHRLRGIAVAMVERHPPDRTLLAVALPATLARSIWITEGEDARAVSEALLSAVLAEARARGLGRVLVSGVEDEAREIRDAVVALGGRPLTALPDYALLLPEGGDFDAYLARLPRGPRHAIRTDFRHIDAAGAIVEERPATPDQLALAWSFIAGTFARYSFVEFGPEPLLPALSRRAAGNVVLDLIRVQDQVFGAMFSIRAGDTLALTYIGHVEAPKVYPYFSLVAHRIRREIERGTHRLVFGPGNGAYKRRIGCQASTRSRFYISTA